MTPKPSAYHEPSTSTSTEPGLQFPPMSHPRLDEHLVPGETREEMLRDELIYAAPAKEPHADLHSDLDYIVRAHIKPGYTSSTNLLTRAGPGSDFATDTAVRKSGIDPDTGTRYLEELAFEIVSTQSMRHIIMRAEDLSQRGVRRLLAIFVARKEVCEWSVSENRFVPLSLDDQLDDPTLARPIPIRALLDAALVDDAVVDALHTKGNRRLREIKARERLRGRESGRISGRKEGRKEGREQGLLDGIESICRILDIELTPERRAYLRELDAAGLQRWLELIETQRGWPRS